MTTAETLDLLAKTLTIISTTLYLLGYIDVGVFLSAIAAAAALMSTILITRMGATLKRYTSTKRMHRLQALQTSTDEPVKRTSVEELEKMLNSLFRIHEQLEAIAEEKIGGKTPAREILALAKARLEVVAKIKDIIVTLEKLRPTAEEKDFTELLRKLVDEEKP